MKSEVGMRKSEKWKEGLLKSEVGPAVAQKGGAMARQDTAFGELRRDKVGKMERKAFEVGSGTRRRPKDWALARHAAELGKKQEDYEFQSGVH